MADDYKDHSSVQSKTRRTQVELRPSLFGHRLMIRVSEPGQPDNWDRWRRASATQVAVANSFLRKMWIT